MWHLNKIPKVIHFYWGNEKLSYLRYLSVLSFRRLNPEWKIKIHVPAVLNTNPPEWNTIHQKNLKIEIDYFTQLIDLDVEIVKHDFSEDFDNFAHEVHKCDFLRWKILATEGGVWSDIDILYVKSIEELAENIDDEYIKSIDVFLCCFRKSKHAIGFLMSAGNNPFYQKIYDLSKKNYDKTQYQCIGSKLIDYNYHSQVKIRKEFGNESKVYFIDPLCVYKLQEKEIPTFFETYDGEINFIVEEKYVIGFHWYAGHPLAQNFESLLNMDNVDQFDNFLSKIIQLKEFNKWL
jgi:hypothetical protein